MRRVRNPDGETRTANAGRARLLVAGQVLVGVIVAYFVYRTIADLLAAGTLSELRFDVPLVVASLALLAVYNVLFVHASQILLNVMGERVGYAATFELTYVSALGKYIPGGIWHIAGRFALADSLKVRKRSVVVMTVFEMALGVVSGILVAVLGLGYAASARIGLPPWVAPVVAAASLVTLHPAIFGRMMAIGLRAAGSDTSPPHLPFATTLALVAYRALGWFVAGAGLMLFARSLYAEAGGGVLLYSGAWAAASVFGLLVIFVPGGIGVREASLMALLTPTLGAGVAGTVGLASRLWATAVELGLSGAALALSARRVRREARG